MHNFGCDYATSACAAPVTVALIRPGDDHDVHHTVEPFAVAPGLIGRQDDLGRVGGVELASSSEESTTTSRPHAIASTITTARPDATPGGVIIPTSGKAGYSDQHLDQYVFDKCGIGVENKGPDYTGVRYFAKRDGLIKEEVRLGELNSDLPDQLEDYLKWAVPQCQANKKEGTDLKIVVTLGAHGAGFAGFGGDMTSKNEGSKVLMSNVDVKKALQNTLDATPWLDKFDLFGFDACLMMSFSQAQDYKDQAHYYIGSEAIEPGHGWS